MTVMASDTVALASIKTVKEASDEAVRLAGEADRAAGQAQTAAGQAQTSAANASEYAARALGNLSTVQNVTETLNWITSHGTMAPTKDYVLSSDTEVVEGKKYYTRTGSGTEADPYIYTEVADPTGDPSSQNYYEGKLDPTHVYFVLNEEFILSEDTTVDSAKTYYELNGSSYIIVEPVGNENPSEEGWYELTSHGDYYVNGHYYSVITEPKIEDISTYYELSIDESLNNYVGTHLAVTSEGLWLIPEEGSTPDTSTKKMLIAVGGTGHTYEEAGTYIIEKVNGVDIPVAKFTSTMVQIGPDQLGAYESIPTYLQLTRTALHIIGAASGSSVVSTDKQFITSNSVYLQSRSAYQYGEVLGGFISHIHDENGFRITNDHGYYPEPGQSEYRELAYLKGYGYNNLGSCYQTTELNLGAYKSSDGKIVSSRTYVLPYLDDGDAMFEALVRPASDAEYSLFKVVGTGDPLDSSVTAELCVALKPDSSLATDTLLNTAISALGWTSDVIE